MVLFLEEDHYVAEDFLSVLTLMKRERDLHYPSCDVLCLGTYLKQTNYKQDHKKVRILRSKLIFPFISVPISGVTYLIAEDGRCLYILLFAHDTHNLFILTTESRTNRRANRT